MAHTPEEKRAFLLGFLYAMAHNGPFLSIEAMVVAAKLVDAWSIDITDQNALHEYEQDFIDAGLRMQDTPETFDKEKLN